MLLRRAPGRWVRYGVTGLALTAAPSPEPFAHDTFAITGAGRDDLLPGRPEEYLTLARQLTGTTEDPLLVG